MSVSNQVYIIFFDGSVFLSARFWFQLPGLWWNCNAFEVVILSFLSGPFSFVDCLGSVFHSLFINYSLYHVISFHFLSFASFPNMSPLAFFHVHSFSSHSLVFPLVLFGFSLLLFPVVSSYCPSTLLSGPCSSIDFFVSLTLIGLSSPTTSTYTSVDTCQNCRNGSAFLGP